MTSDMDIFDNQRTGDDLMERIIELEADGIGYGWRYLLQSCGAEIQRLKHELDAANERDFFTQTPTCPQCGTTYRCRLESRGYRCKCGEEFYSVLNAYTNRLIVKPELAESPGEPRTQAENHR